jgi:hypothetical protein
MNTEGKERKRDHDNSDIGGLGTEEDVALTEWWHMEEASLQGAQPFSPPTTHFLMPLVASPDGTYFSRPGENKPRLALGDRVSPIQTRALSSCPHCLFIV